MAGFLMDSSLASVFNSPVLQRLSFDSAAFVLGAVLCFVIAVYAKLVAKGSGASPGKLTGKKQKKAKRSQKKSVGPSGRQPKNNSKVPGEAPYSDPEVPRETPSSDPETTTDIEFSVPTYDEDASAHVKECVEELLVLEGTVQTHTAIDAQHDHDVHEIERRLHSKDRAPTIAEPDDFLASLDCHCLPVVSTTPHDSQANISIASSDKISDDSICCCGDEFFWGCQRCAAYSSTLLLAHRGISIRIAEGPPGLTNQSSSADDRDDEDDWQAWLAEQ